MKEKLKQKIKSYSFWTSLSAAVVILFQSISSVCGFSVNETQITNIIMAICGILVVFGVVAMPTKETTLPKIEEKNIEDTKE